MKNLVLAVLVSVVLLTTGCAFTDRFLLKRETRDGVELFTDAKGEPTTEPVDPVTGRANEPRYESAPAPAVSGLASLLRAFPGWGDAAFYGVVSLASLYAAWRTKKLVVDARTRKAAIAAGMVVVNAVIADWKAGVLDSDRDGTVSLAEIADYIKAKAIKSLTPEGIQAILKVISDVLLPEPQKTAALEEIAAEL